MWWLRKYLSTFWCAVNPLHRAWRRGFRSGVEQQLLAAEHKAGAALPPRPSKDGHPCRGSYRLHGPDVQVFIRRRHPNGEVWPL